MRRIVVDAPHGALGFDCDTRLSREQYSAARALGFRFVARYLGDLTSDEVDDCIGSGLLLLPVQHAHAPGWIVGEGGHTGAEDGRRAVADANAAALPQMPLWFDLEQPHTATTPAQVHQYAAEACAAVGRPGFEGRVYWGAGMPGNEHDVYMLQFTGYWKSFSNVVTPWKRGFQLIQLFRYPRGECYVREVFPLAPASIADVLIDVDVACSDYEGSSAKMLAALP